MNCFQIASCLSTISIIFVKSTSSIPSSTFAISTTSTVISAKSFTSKVISAVISAFSVDYSN